MEIENYPNYLIYDDGRVYNQKYKRFLKQSQDRDGYFQLNLYNKNGRKLFRVHRLVAEQYINNPDPDNYKMIDHIDQINTNNNKNNLRWVNNSLNKINSKTHKNNKLGHKYLRFIEDKHLYKFHIPRLRICKYFKTIDEAIKYRDDFYYNNKEILSI